ncbi:TPA: hypothetical protein ACGUTO_003981 [Vibrio vulnificus]
MLLDGGAVVAIETKITRPFLGRFLGWAYSKIKSALGLSNKTSDLPKGLDDKVKNKLNHLFGQEKHKLEPLIDKFDGDQEKALKAIDDAA